MTDKVTRYDRSDSTVRVPSRERRHIYDENGDVIGIGTADHCYLETGTHDIDDGEMIYVDREICDMVTINQDPCMSADETPSIG